MQGRLLVTYLLLTSLSVGALFLWTDQKLQAFILEEAEHELEIEAFLLADTLHQTLAAWLQTGIKPEHFQPTVQMQYLRSVDSLRFVLTDAQRRVLFSTDARVPVGAVLHEHPELVAAQSGREQHNQRLDEWSGEERLFVAASVRDVHSGRVLGLVQLSTLMTRVHSQIWESRLSLFIVGSLILLATVLVSWRVAVQIAQPVRALTLSVERFARGHLDQRVSLEGPAEIQMLGHSFNQMAERLREFISRQEAFIANAAHEIRSPLTSMRLRLDMLQAHGRNDPKLYEHYLRQIEDDVIRLQNLASHLLMLCAVDDGKSHPTVLLDLSTLIYQLADDVYPLIQHSRLKLLVDVPSHLPPVRANPEQISIAIRNLLDNAIKYTPSGGQVLLRAFVTRCEEAPSDAKKLHRGYKGSDAPGVALPSHKRMVVIQVSDTGVGIPPEALPHVFERFYRADNARARWRGGGGLGLSIVRSIVENYGGQVSVTSTLSKGSTFTLHLPVANGCPISADESAAGAETGGSVAGMLTAPQ